MNPLLKAQFDAIVEQLDTLESVLENNRQEVNKQHEEKEELLQEKWRQRKHVTTLDRIAKEYDEVEAENSQYREERTEIRKQLTDIVNLSKALHGLQKKP